MCHRWELAVADCYFYKARHFIENFFAKLKQYRGIATRYDKTTGKEIAIKESAPIVENKLRFMIVSLGQ